eukprot:m.16340 g.16340  ORF g.16340 m.16340 type:complete len:236 (-) comp5227_c0_seq1:185-892(-)
MVKLTQDLVILSTQFTNPLKQREIDLRGNKVAVIENLGATMDQFDTIDLTNNEIKKLDGFPILLRLKTLLLSNNRVARIAPGIGTKLPNLEELVLTNNSLTDLGDLFPLKDIPSLTRLSLSRNPVTRLKNYRLFVIHLLPALKLLDFQKVKPQERDTATELFESEEGQKLLGEFAQNIATTEDTAAPVPAADTKQLEAIKEAISNASSLEEVRRLEAQLKQGVLPTTNGTTPMEQ